MKNNIQVICFGELLVDMISATTGDLSHAKSFLPKFGGAPANTAIGLAKLGINVQFMGKVGNDPFGQFLKQTLIKHKVDTSTLHLSDTDKTTLAFVSLEKNGERDFFFYRGAHENLNLQEFNLTSKPFVFHFGSLTQVTPQARATTEKLITQAKNHGAIISYDPNIRESLWGDMQTAKDIIIQTIQKVTIVKVNKEEALFLSGKDTVEEACDSLFSKNLEAILVTLGSEGCYYKTKNNTGHVPGISVTPVDTTGAGDAFNAGYIFALCTNKKRIQTMTHEDLRSALQQANKIAALTTTKKGAITAFPTKNRLQTIR